MQAKERLYLTGDRKALVGEGDRRAASLYAVPGDEIPQSAAERFGLVDGRLKSSAARTRAEQAEAEAKAKAEAEAKAKAKAEAEAQAEVEAKAMAEKDAKEKADKEAKRGDDKGGGNNGGLTVEKRRKG